MRVLERDLALLPLLPLRLMAGFAAHGYAKLSRGSSERGSANGTWAGSGFLESAARAR